MAFSQYSKQAPQAGKAVPYALRGLLNPDGTNPILHVEHIGESNRAFWLEVLARASAKARTGRGQSSTPIEMDRAHREDREQNREDLIKFSARQVENAFHDDGSPATTADIPAIVRALPEPDFDALWAFVQNYSHYRSYAIKESPQALAEK